MTTARQRALDDIKIGDVIYGVSGNGNEKLLLVYRADEKSIFARHITSKSWAEFDRDGQSRPIATGGSCRIVSTARMPADQYQVAIGLDHKLQTASKEADYRLSNDEIQLILSYGAFFKAHLLPE